MISRKLAAPRRPASPRSRGHSTSSISSTTSCATSTPREAVAPVGAGDAFLAGYVAARYEGKPPPECLRYGVACGTDSVQRLGAGLVDPHKVERLVPEVGVERLPTPAEVG